MIIRSIITSDIRQIDGRRAIVEMHENSDGTTIPIYYLTEAKQDVQSILVSHAQQLNDGQQQVVEIADTQARLDKLRAVALLTLKDDLLADALRVPLDALSEAKDALVTEAATVMLVSDVVAP